MNRKNIILIAILVLLIGIGIGSYTIFNKKDEKDKVIITDAEKFAKDYPTVNDDNVFVYRDAKQIINILKKGTGVVYLGFDECPWCQSYVVYLNEIAKEIGIDKIFYLDILEDRTNHSEEYQEILKLLGKNLDNDEEGNPRVFVPDVSFVIKGEIIGHDNETANGTKGIKDPDEYWSDEKRLNNLKTKLREYMELIYEENCNECEV